MTRKNRPPCARTILAWWLMLSVALPTPALALREIQEEGRAGLEAIRQALAEPEPHAAAPGSQREASQSTGTGLEEPTPEAETPDSEEIWRPYQGLSCHTTGLGSIAFFRMGRPW